MPVKFLADWHARFRRGFLFAGSIRFQLLPVPPNKNHQRQQSSAENLQNQLMRRNKILILRCPNQLNGRFFDGLRNIVQLKMAGLDAQFFFQQLKIIIQHEVLSLLLPA